MSKDVQSESESLVISAVEAGERLDKILAQRYKEIRSRTYFQMLIVEHNVLVNGIPVKKGVKVQEGDEIDICFVLSPEIDINPEYIPLEIIFEDEHMLVINKPAGMVVHPAPGNWSGTFVNALLYHCNHLAANKDNLRPGIVHRLDKNTSGLLIAAKTSLAQQRLIEMFVNRLIYKEYLAVCIGNPGKGEIDLPIGRHPIHRQKMAISESHGRKALTLYETLSCDGQLSIVRIILATGRTHQIRVHMQHHKTPILGDPVYGILAMNKKFQAERQLLHAYILKFSHPITEQRLEFHAPIPIDMSKYTDARMG